MVSIKIYDKLKLKVKRKESDLDLSAITKLHSEIIQTKPYLNKLYLDFYNEFKNSIQGDIEKKIIVELGSGGGFLKKIIPNAITSDIIQLPTIDKNFSANDMPFENKKIDAFFMLDVLHHIHDPISLFKEVNRCLKTNGKSVMIEPANTIWGRFIWKYFHHEPFDPQAGWGFQKGDPLFNANSALPWIIFCRDRCRFEEIFPELKIVEIRPHTPFQYIISGGLSLKQLLPSMFFSYVKHIEYLLSPLNPYIGIFYTIKLIKG